MASVVNPNLAGSQAQNARQSGRQTRTNPSRISKTVARSYSFFGNSSNVDAPPAPPVPHGFYPALTHFTDSVAALPREFRRHNALLKEVDAKAWALEDNLQQLLKIASESDPVPCPPNPAPIMDGVVRDDYPAPSNTFQEAESQESKNRRLLFDRIRHTLSDLMMTADEKNHVITNANDELDHQLFRLDSIFPYISGEVSDEARLGSLTHWAYTNRGAVKPATVTAHERPRRETAVNNHHLHSLHDPEVASRSEARREAVLARKQRRAHLDSDFDEVRPTGRKGAGAKARVTAAGENTGDGTASQPKRRKVEKSQAAAGGAAMERSQSGVASAIGRAASKDAAGVEPKKRARAPNTGSVAGRKRNNTVTSNAGSPTIASSPVVGTFNPIRNNAASPGPNSAPRPQSSRAQQVTNVTANGRQRPPSSASIRANNGKSADTKAGSKEGTAADEATPSGVAASRAMTIDTGAIDVSKSTATAVAKAEDREDKKRDQTQDADAPLPSATTTTSRGRVSKTSTPVVANFPETIQRSRSSRNNAADTTTQNKRSAHKKSGSVSVVQQPPPAPASEDEESSREGDDEDDEGEPRYCYCNQVSFGEMVACDNDACPREWFHLSCVGLTKPPGKNVKWYCNECKENIRRGRAAGGR